MLTKDNGKKEEIVESGKPYRKRPEDIQSLTSGGIC
jgi:hypothetical protein